MNPKNLGFEECEIKTLPSNSHKKTQTIESSASNDCKTSSKSNITPNCPPSKNVTSDAPIAVTEDCENGSITVFEYSQIFKDPGSPKSFTIIRESITEEIHKHPSKFLTDDSTSNRYRYCKEVIKPYLKDYPSDCPSDEISIQDALDSANEEFPDYQPCYEVYGGEEDIKEKISQTDKSVSCKSSYSSAPSKLDAATSCKSSKTSTPIMDCKKSDEKLPKKDSGTKIESCPSTEKPKKKSCKSSEHFGIKEPIDPPKSKKEDNVTKNPDVTSCTKKEKTAEQAHNEAVITIKYAMEDFAHKVYDTTKDVICVIRTESAKQLETIQTEGVKHLETFKTESAKQLENINKCLGKWTDTDKPVQKKCSETSTNFTFFKKIESQNSEETDKGTEPKPIRTGESLQDIVGKLNSKASVLGQKISENWPDAFKFGSNYNDSSSPYDTPIKKCNRPPKQVSNIIVPDSVTASSSVFSTIKSKIFALFSDPQKPVDNLSVKSSTSSSSTGKDDDDDENIIDRLIE